MFSAANGSHLQVQAQGTKNPLRLSGSLHKWHGLLQRHLLLSRPRLSWLGRLQMGSNMIQWVKAKTDINHRQGPGIIWATSSPGPWLFGGLGQEVSKTQGCGTFLIEDCNCEIHWNHYTPYTRVVRCHTARSVTIVCAIVCHYVDLMAELPGPSAGSNGKDEENTWIAMQCNADCIVGKWDLFFEVEGC